MIGICAMHENDGLIGIKDKLPWNYFGISIDDDMDLFKHLTTLIKPEENSFYMNRLLCGKNTFSNLPKQFMKKENNRYAFVLSSDVQNMPPYLRGIANFSLVNMTYANSILDKMEAHDENLKFPVPMFNIGGAQTYKSFFNRTHVWIITKLTKTPYMSTKIDVSHSNDFIYFPEDCRKTIENEYILKYHSPRMVQKCTNINNDEFPSNSVHFHYEIYVSCEYMKYPWLGYNRIINEAIRKIESMVEYPLPQSRL